MHPSMAVRSRKVSFDLLSNDSSGDDTTAAPSVLLHRSLSDPSAINVGDEPSKPGRRRRRTSKAARKRKNSVIGVVTEAKLDWTDESDHGTSGISEDVRASETVLTTSSSCVSHVELRQRVVVNGGGFLEGITASRADGEGDGATESSSGQWRPAEPNGSIARLETVGSLDWKRVMAEDCSPLGGVPVVEKYPWRYFMGELYGGNSLRSTTSVGNENKRQKNALMVYVCEIMVDVIKHSFLAKFNEIKPVAYSQFLEDLCKQTLKIQSEDGGKSLQFVPLAPACVVIRVLTPIYAAHLPYGPLLWRWLWIVLLSAMTYVMLVTLKIMVGLGLHLHATWYVNRCLKKKHHLD
ncbi:Protein POLLEN DEFECTIVE IN GUIDANCE 1 [Acorus gramineus]|uniref:Protein POLLEN DEFECTIVE IN GUIDANCE 1 n=1 Tax=Acorus gramineus TaxID=55184 RepID=A0AAV9BKY3_ACOGR|nr:Protein POLLEN DEFECTIVE IN GUIDANCE 1 [Acorus gramineus]